jgi:hypothetical protein
MGFLLAIHGGRSVSHGQTHDERAAAARAEARRLDFSAVLGDYALADRQP